jgi:hypothetical protein
VVCYGVVVTWLPCLTVVPCWSTVACLAAVPCLVAWFRSGGPQTAVVCLLSLAAVPCWLPGLLLALESGDREGREPQPPLDRDMERESQSLDRES